MIPALTHRHPYKIFTFITETDWNDPNRHIWSLCFFCSGVPQEPRPGPFQVFTWYTTIELASFLTCLSIDSVCSVYNIVTEVLIIVSDDETIDCGCPRCALFLGCCHPQLFRYDWWTPPRQVEVLLCCPLLGLQPHSSLGSVGFSSKPEFSTTAPEGQRSEVFCGAVVDGVGGLWVIHHSVCVQKQVTSAEQNKQEISPHSFLFKCSADSIRRSWAHESLFPWFTQKLGVPLYIFCICDICLTLHFLCACNHPGRGDSGVSEWAASDLSQFAIQARALSVHPQASQWLCGSFPATAPGRGQRHRPGSHLLPGYAHRHNNTHTHTGSICSSRLYV